MSVGGGGYPTAESRRMACQRPPGPRSRRGPRAPPVSPPPQTHPSRWSQNQQWSNNFTDLVLANSVSGSFCWRYVNSRKLDPDSNSEIHLLGLARRNQPTNLFAIFLLQLIIPVMCIWCLRVFFFECVLVHDHALCPLWQLEVVLFF